MNENRDDDWPFVAIDNGDIGSVSRMLDASASEPGEPVVGSTPRDDDDDLPGGHDGLWVVDDHDEDAEGGAVTDRTWWLRSAGDWRRARERIGGYAYLRPDDRSLVFTAAVPSASERRRFERW
jgi:hypothetical protein